eukprot:TRINITY_DN80179_c0_g1_i1.p1 TRINITY_DN80179_c0_g1~~TRINITY_DN80179_c0_g1_i1.p1  ORF type:complete len:409 (-),score=81.61 TRINITY_DN80179_c0_g1_i1:208-1434(-)
MRPFKPLAAIAALASAAPQGGPEQFHLAVTSTPGELIVTYVTKDGDSSSCEVDGVGSFSGSTRTYTDGGWQGVIHAVKLTGLNASTSYDYSCAGEKRQLRTPPPPATLPIKIAAVADLGSACPKPGCGDATIAALAKAMANQEAHALVHAGDIAYTSGDQDVWDEYMREMDPSVSRVPYMVCPGNHEHYFDFSGYRHRFDMPDNNGEASQKNLWSSFDIGGVHFLALSTEHTKSPDIEAQVAFVEADLKKAAANRQSVPWIVVYGHKPLYCSTEDYYDCKIGSIHLRTLFEDLFRKYGVDLYLTGHLHNYERTWPLFNGTVEAQSYSNIKDTVHVVIGSAGDDEGLTDRWETCPSWSVVREGKHVGYAELTFQNATTMDFRYLNAATGNLIDSFTLTKERSEDEQLII